MLATTVRYVNRKQKRLIEEAAKRRNLSGNQFFLQTAERVALLDIGRLPVGVDPLVIDKWVEPDNWCPGQPLVNLQQTQELGESLIPEAHNSPVLDPERAAYCGACLAPVLAGGWTCDDSCPRKKEEL